MSGKINFIDQIRVVVRSGNGGRGAVHFLRTKYNAKAGPDGGDGGRGGHIYLRANPHLWTLFHLRWRKNIVATDGGNGEKNNAKGADGQDVIVEVPLGTVVRDERTGQIEGEVLSVGEDILWIRGGRGGKGNKFFATAVNRAPTHAQAGQPGYTGTKIIELKLLADVGMVGLPNAGKSTLLSVLSAARPKIGDYPFTTLLPQLGIVKYKDNQSFCLADLPGLIEGAAQGKGLGLRFLRHIERNTVLLFVISCETEDIRDTLRILQNELLEYKQELQHKRQVLALTKSDVICDQRKAEITAQVPPGMPFVMVCAYTTEGLDALKHLLYTTIPPR